MADESSSAGEKQAAEAWAEAKGMLPERLTTPARMGSILTSAERVNPKYHLFAQARAHNSWPIGFELTEEQFDHAVKEANSLEIR